MENKFYMNVFNNNYVLLHRKKNHTSSKVKLSLSREIQHELIKKKKI